MASTPDQPPALFARGDLAGAERGCRRMLKRSPGHVPSLHLLGLIALRRGRVDDALRRLDAAARRAPANVDVLEAQAEALRRAGRLDEAERTARLALRFEPRRATTQNVLGLVQLAAGTPAEAAGTFMEAARLGLPGPEALLNLTVAMNRVGEYDRALQLASRIDARWPGLAPNAINRGQAYRGLGRIDEAAAAFETAGDDPMARYNLGQVLLHRGDLARGLTLLEARREVTGFGRARRRPAWDGAADPAATLLVVAEQGLGDAILMSRFLVPLAERMGRVVVEAPASLHALLATLHPGLAFTAPGEPVAHDAWCSDASLPLRFGIRALDELPVEPWIPVRSARTPRPRLRAGINWAGNPRFAQDAVRSAPLTRFARLLAVDEVEWVSLNLGPRAGEADAFGLPRPLEGAAHFLDTARVLADLDLVVSTETAVPNLSAAMGVPTLVLGSTEVDWRWNGWYRDVRVCAQPSPGDWDGAVDLALAHVRERVAGGGGADALRTAA